MAVPKKDGSLRLCVDYRKLNKATEHDAYPMPRVDDIIDQLGQAPFITTIDLNRGYWQIPLAAEDRHKTAFSTPSGLYQFTVMPFGLNGAPATFQRLMDNLLRGLESFSAAYLDDIIVYSATWEEHLCHLKKVLEKLRAAGLTIKTRKCQFGMPKCVYLGHVIGSGEVTPDPSKLQSVQGYPRPKTKKEIRRFLGLAGYYRRLIPDFASIAAPLSDLTKKSAPNLVQWSSQCDSAFQKLKELLCSHPVLKSPDFSKEFILQTDASERGVGAVLSQTDDEGREHPVSYYSHKLSPREDRYSVVEKECLVIARSIHAFRVYLLGRHYTIQRALQWLDNVKDHNGHLCLWSFFLQPYRFHIKHCPGSYNQNADALSRTCTEVCPTE